jgi:LysR family transcriptional regulator, carnitine catabolism transcriptional activator
MNLGLKHFRGFVAVAKHLHFGRAADEINVSKPTLTLLIQQMESVVGTALLNRNTRWVELTDLGREFLPLATSIVEDLNSSISYMQDFVELKRGKVTVATLPSTAVNKLPSIVVAFKQRYPDIVVRIEDGAAEFVFDRVRSRGVDFALASSPNKYRGLDFDRIYNDEIKLLMPKSHPLAGQQQVSWAQIIDEEIVVVSNETGTRQLIDEMLARKGMRIKAILEPTIIQTVVAMVLAGAGLGIILSSYLSTLPTKNLVVASLVGPSIFREVGMVTRSGQELMPAARALHDMIVQQLKEGDGGQPRPIRSRRRARAQQPA